jgi:uncharacterized membrane protein HdeD (DUF308 family)
MSVEMTYLAVTEVDDANVRSDLREFGRSWWIFLIAGLVWIFVALLVLQFDQTSINTITAIVGIVFFLAAFEEALHAVFIRGWMWLHLVLTALFLVGGAWAFIYSTMTFGVLAILLSWFLLIGGTVEIVASLMNRDAELWWLGLITGVLLVAVAFWAIGDPNRSGWLLALWVGLGALFRGLSRIVFAFQVRSLKGLRP